MDVEDISSEILAIGIAWIGMVVLVGRLTMRSPAGSVGLPMAFLFSTTFAYCGFMVYAVPGYSHLRAGGDPYLQAYDFSENTVFLGALASVIGIAGFTVGCWVASRHHRLQTPMNELPLVVDPAYRQKLMLWLGLFGFFGFILNGVSIPVPMAQAFAQVGRNVAVVVVCLGAALVVLADRRANYLKWVMLGAAIPPIYLIAWGFTSYGFTVFTEFAAFWLAVLASRRLGAVRIGLTGAVLVYVLLSLFVTWMSFRQELRAVLWSDAGFDARISAIFDAFSKTELLSPSNFDSLDWLNGRLNQYIFVGKAIEWHTLTPGLRINGETLFLALVAWVPRFLWPGKPEMGGSDFVATHTGMQFSEGTTFGAGPVFELFVNFGYVGVFVGFVVLGLLVYRIDRTASIALRQGRLFDYVYWFTIGLAFMEPLTDSFFLVSSAIMSWLVMMALKFLIGSPVADNEASTTSTRMPQ